MSGGTDTPARPVTVMLVDDSAVIRGLMTRALAQDSMIQVVATAGDGEMAIRVITQHQVDVIILDIEMPKMDGLTALPKLLELSPYSHVIMASSLTQRNAEISLRALSLGAADYVPKPSSREDAGAIEGFYRELREKVRALGHASQQSQKPAATTKPIVVRAAAASGAATSVVVRGGASTISYPSQRVEALAIASSTGGPQALSALLMQVRAHIRSIPVFVTQHMPAKFTALLADHLAKETGLRCTEAQHGEVVRAGSVYIAPGNYHMTVERNANGYQIALNQEPPVNFCRPAADPMLISLAKLYKQQLLVAVLTGMGSDGLNGARMAVEQGGSVIAQDEATSVVWGMPGAVAGAHLCRAILPIGEMGDYINRATAGGAHAAR